jgi:23S rRNA pseudouridine1911/1915/1917 synthase
MRFEAGPEDAGNRLDLFLSRYLKEVSRSGLQAMNGRGQILVNGCKEKAGYRIHAGDVVLVEESGLEPFEDVGVKPEPIPLEILFEDSALALVDKPAGLVVHPGAGNRTGTLANALRARFPELSDASGPSRPGIVHRLDKWTSGLLLIAKTNAAHRQLSKSFQEREIRKTYLALVHGRLRSQTGSIDLSIGRHPTARKRMAVRPGEGRSAHSEYRVLERAGSLSLIQVTIATGRTHQIRVHLSAIGHPVVGDPTYGDRHHRLFVRKNGPFERYFLHASELEFPHPTTGQRMAFVSPLPSQLQTLWERLRSGD